MSRGSVTRQKATHEAGDPLLASPSVPIASSPRRPNSIRRTTTHDAVRPEGLRGPVTVLGRGRDLFTDADHSGAVLDVGRVELRAEYLKRRVISISSEPSYPELAALVGANPFSGFRDAIGDLMPRERAAHSIRFRLLYDLAPALLVSGRALRAAGVPIEMPGRTRNPVDICAGWVQGGTLLRGLTEAGPPLHVGPIAPTLWLEDDPLSWHDADPLPVHATRRSRRLDLWPDNGAVLLESYFRDSHVDTHGRETIVHEYGLRGAIDPLKRRILWCVTTPGALPYPECPSAAGSADRLVGMHLSEVTALVRREFIGSSTCTHLNDTFRCLEDAEALMLLLKPTVRTLT
jgi:hypothetical protein